MPRQTEPTDPERLDAIIRRLASLYPEPAFLSGTSPPEDCPVCQGRGVERYAYIPTREPFQPGPAVYGAVKVVGFRPCLACHVGRETLRAWMLPQTFDKDHKPTTPAAFAGLSGEQLTAIYLRGREVREWRGIVPPEGETPPTPRNPLANGW